MARIQILDSGSGNLFSIANALRRVSPSIVTEVSSDFKSGRYDGLVLPGVGSFSSAQRILLQNREEIIYDLRVRKMPLLGICLGMQLLFEESEEGPGEGLKLFKGRVMRFRFVSRSMKVPHIGWNTLSVDTDSRFCRGLHKEEWAYYVHSYFPEPVDQSIVKAWTTYGDQKFPAIVERENILGTQFHPEKSQMIGVKLISNFVSMCAKNGVSS